MSKKLIEYIKKSLESGKTEAEIRENLLQVGWDKERIDQGITTAKGGKEKKNNGSSKVKVAIGSVVVILALLGVFVFGHDLFFEQSDEEEIQSFDNEEQLIEKFNRVWDLEYYKTTISIEGKSETDGGDSGEEFNLMVGIENAFPEKLKVGIEGEMTYPGTTISLDGMLWYVEGNLYGRIDTFPPVFFLTGSELDDILNKNILLAEDIEDEFEELFNNNENFPDDIDPQKAGEALDYFLSQIVNENSFTITGTGKDVLNSEEVSMYELEFNFDNIQKSIEKSADRYPEIFKEYDGTDDDIDEIKKQIQENDIRINLWANEDYVLKVEVVGNIEEDKVSGFFSIGIEFSDFNKEPDIESPQEYISFEDLTFFEDSLEESRFPAYDTQIRSQLSQVRSFAEMHYYDEGGTYEGFENSENWNNLAYEIPECSKDRLPQGEESYRITIDDQEYAAWAPLCSSEGYYCVDSTGESREFTGNPIREISCNRAFQAEL